MAGLPHNISKSAFRKGEYVGHANGAWRIHKDKTSRIWCAIHPLKPWIERADTLCELSKKIEKYNLTIR